MKARYLVVVAFVAVGVGFQQLIAHQHHADALAKTIVTKDASALDTSVEEASLQEYSKAHMGLSRKLLLTGSYNRAVQAAQAASNPQSNGNVYAQAQAACAGRADSITQAKCVQAYLASHSAPSSNPQAVAPPKKADFTRSIESAPWTPDSAGVALLVAVVAMSGSAYLLAMGKA